MRFIAMLVAAVLMVTAQPALAHTAEEQANWYAAWEERVIASGFSPKLLREWQDFRNRHEPRRVVVKRIRITYDVEQWRSLVEAYFQPGTVDSALAVISCESGGNPYAKNRSSSALGLWQFLRGTWNWVAGETGSPSYDEGGPTDPEWATINAAWLSKGGTNWKHWSCKP